VEAQPKRGVEPRFERRQPLLVQARALTVRERARRQVGQRLTSPERQRRAEQLVSPAGLAGGERAAAFGRLPLELAQVELPRTDLDPVAVGAGLDHRPPAVQRLAEPRDVPLERVPRGRRRAIAPELVDQALARDHSVRVEQEDCQERALFRAADRDLAAVLDDLERAEDPELHDPLVPPLARL
jgi:hypothetical protein